MVEIYEKQIEQTNDLVEIAELLTEDSFFKKNIAKYLSSPYDASVERVANGVFTIAVSKAESPSLDHYDATTALTKANNEALAKLSCIGARLLTTKNTDDRRINALGLIKNKKNIASMAFDCKGDTIYLVGKMDDDDVVDSRALDAIVKGIEQDLVTSAHYISSNGLFLSLLEACAPNELGFDITSDAEVEDKEFLFGKSKYIAIVSVNDEQENEFIDFLFNNHVEVTLLGHVTKGELRLDDLSFGHITNYIPE